MLSNYISLFYRYFKDEGILFCPVAFGCALALGLGFNFADCVKR